MANNSAGQALPRSARTQSRGTVGDSSRRKSSHARMPSSAGYLIVAVTVAVLLFAATCWLLGGGDEAPWVPAGLITGVFLLVLFSAREVVMRRAWTRYVLEQDKQGHSSRDGAAKSGSTKTATSAAQHSAALRIIQKQSAEVDSGGGPVELHSDLYHLCQDYLTSTDDALRSSGMSAESRLAIRSGQEKVRALQKHHMLTWARDSCRAITHEAQQRARTTDKIETANRALDCIATALKAYPEEAELDASSVAIREFIASVKVAHWVELAERTAFKGHYRRAIERYKDALFYLNRETVKDDVREAGAERIVREIDMLRARLKALGKSEDSPPRKRNSE